MISGERQKLHVMQKAARYLCGVCGRGVGCNLIQCTSCQKWVHKKCSMSSVCRGCLNSATGISRTSVDIGASANLELVDKFCYLGDRISVDEDADAATETRIRIGWNKFRQ